MDTAILVATIELLSEVGYARLTVAEVARRSGVSKRTIYRRWARKSQLVVEAMVTQVPTSLAPDTGSISGDLLSLTQQLITTMTKTPMGRVLPGLVAELAADTDVELVLDALAFPLSIWITGEPIDPDYAPAAVDLVLARYGSKGR